MDEFNTPCIYNTPQYLKMSFLQYNVNKYCACDKAKNINGIYYNLRENILQYFYYKLKYTILYRKNFNLKILNINTEVHYSINCSIHYSYYYTTY